jgi:hypothetical protein
MSYDRTKPQCNRCGVRQILNADGRCLSCQTALDAAELERSRKNG